MKPPTRAPFYAMLYPGLCDVARKHGYALAVHGSLTNDLDVIACPWVPDAVPAEELYAALLAHLGACEYEDLLRRDGLPEEIVVQIMKRAESDHGMTQKPHGRRAWNLYLWSGSRVDLSVMPRACDPR